MLSSVASLKESLIQIANAVHDDDDDEISNHTPRGQRLENGTPVSGRRFSANLGVSNSSVDSPIINQYKSEIKRLQESEAEIKALSVNYASLLKEKEDLILRLAEENGSLKENISTTNGSLAALKKNIKGGGDIVSPRDHRAPAKTRIVGKEVDNRNGNVDFSNEVASKNGKELLGSREEANRSVAIQESYERRINQMKDELDKERTKFASLQSRLQEEQKCNASLQQELSSLKYSNNNTSSEIQKAYDELNKKILENKSLQIELQNREETHGIVENLKKQIALLEDENQNLKKEKVDFEAALKEVRSYPARKELPGGLPSDKEFNSISETSGGNEEMLQHMRKLERELQESSQDRDKALKELSRLKQHLLEKESEESEKMDEDTKVIEELRAVTEQQRTQISRLEQALKHALRIQEEMRLSHNNELLNSMESIDELNKKLSGCMNSLQAKNTEIQNLQTALGQYYAEMEAKERLVEEFSVKKEELARISNQLKVALQQIETLNKEKDLILERQSQVDSMLAEGKSRVKKLEGDNEKLHRALEKSMTRVNRMSMDSDFLVDRRIVIKLLVTYFQRNHSKEVLDLMVRMLGFSDEDKQRIGIAQQGTGKGLVRGVLGLPGRLVGGMLSTGSSESNATVASDNQTFADLWVDFLLKETEREMNEASDAQNSSVPTPHVINTAYINQNQASSPSHGISMHRELSSEFSTVPLTSSQSFRPLPR